MANDDLTMPYNGGNALLDALPAHERNALLPDLRVRYGDSGDLVLAGDGPIERVCFPIDAMFSVTARLHDGTAYEVGAVGRHGVVGAELALGSSFSARAVICQVDGWYGLLAADTFADVVERHHVLREHVRAAFAVQLFHAEQSVVCNTAHTVGERAARWVLTIADHIGRDSFALRPEFFAMMLGLPPHAAQRGLDALVAMEALQYQRPVVSILDGAQLMDVACECHQTVMAYRARISSSNGGTEPPRR